MPIFEYACRACGKEFEQLVLTSRPSEEPLLCPCCGSPDVDKLISQVAVDTPERRRTHLEAEKQSNRRGVWRDKRHAEIDAIRRHEQDH